MPGNIVHVLERGGHTYILTYNSGQVSEALDAASEWFHTQGVPLSFKDLVELESAIFDQLLNEED